MVGPPVTALLWALIGFCALLAVLDLVLSRTRRMKGEQRDG